MAFFTMEFATQAKINVGIITTIWCINPLFMAIMDFIIFRTRLEYYHFIGSFSIIVCSILIGMSKINMNYSIVKVEEIGIPAYIPVIFSILTPMCFTTRGMMIKHLSKVKGFDTLNLSFSTYLLVNFIILMVAISLWYTETLPFNRYLFWIGFGGSCFNTLGNVCQNMALSNGPAGPVSALVALSNILLVIV